MKHDFTCTLAAKSFFTDESNLIPALINLGNEKEEEGSNNVFRETVLLTEDRILRVKALCHNVPVKVLRESGKIIAAH